MFQNGDIVVLPYCRDRTGQWTFTDEFIGGLFRMMQRDGTAEMVFHDNRVRTEADFINLLQAGATFVVMVRGEPGGVCWLNHFQFRWAQLHFTTFSEVWGKETVRIGRETLKTLIHMKDRHGDYLWDAFLGITPLCNTHACEYVQRCGGKKIGIFPNGVWFEKEQESRDALLISYTRDDCLEAV